MEIIPALLMSIALSIDGFGVGLAYGIKEVKIKFIHICLISISAAIVMMASILFGQVMADLIPHYFDKLIGGSILLIIGLWQLADGWKKTRLSKLKEQGIEKPVLMTIKIKALGIIFQVLCDPTEADLDHSGDINLKEALLLGVALNIDAFGAGIGAGLAGFSLILVPISALFLLITMLIGLLIGKRYSSKVLKEKGYLFTGVLLILIGMRNFI